MDSLQVCGHAMPVTGAVVAKFHPVSYGGSIRLSFVIGNAFFGFALFLFVSFKVKYLITLCDLIFDK